MDVSLAPPAAAGDAAFVAGVADLVNRVYAEAERGLWTDGARRTGVAEVEAGIRAGQLALARLDDEIVGAVRVRLLGGGVGEFGMLAASPHRRGLGVGTRLVAFAERWARARGATRMQLELLVPRAWTHPGKESLRAWYTRLGYRPVRTGRLEETYPALEPQLATPCDLVTYRKSLAGSRPA